MSDATPSVLPASGRLAGIDYGTVRIGVAISDPSQMLSSPLENYNRGDLKADERFFRRLVEEERLVGFVVGLPIHLDGSESQKSTEARTFGDWLQQLTNLPVVYYDERFTSLEAGRLLEGARLTKKKRKQRLDKLAAQILLAGYLESSRRHEAAQGLDDRPSG
ncbi:Holliday junction resolvase RuvX [Lignipirellula cremea]|uniref:Putative pre-16S rRNA nuclease n=1 Tax=Lignipirellula cremea TaxID=2528010 RepID=A0A518DNU7_9BACT|nr:Holliday junction resolvase RuvX [Lignipirellula cremea]QDU93510.1 Putative Holliday junction resolvase [Lignipirellula cremea]